MSDSASYYLLYEASLNDIHESVVSRIIDNPYDPPTSAWQQQDPADYSMGDWGSARMPNGLLATYVTLWDMRAGDATEMVSGFRRAQDLGLLPRAGFSLREDGEYGDHWKYDWDGKRLRTGPTDSEGSFYATEEMLDALLTRYRGDCKKVVAELLDGFGRTFKIPSALEAHLEQKLAEAQN